MKKELAIGLVAISLAIGMTATATAQDSSEDGQVDVTVDGVTQVDVRPTELSYSDLTPGDEATPQDEANGFSAIEVENIGSNAIEAIWAESTMPGTNPFGTGDVTNYDSGNFVTLSTETANSGDYPDLEGSITGGTSTDMHYVNRVEYSMSPAPTYISTLEGETDETVLANDPAFDGDVGAHVGRFQEGGEWYFYVLYYDDSLGTGACSGGDDAELWIGTDAHTNTELGTTDFTENTADIDVVTLTNTDDGDVGTTDSSVSVGDLTYRVNTFCDDNAEEASYTQRARFNVNPEGPNEEVLGEDTGAGLTAIFDGEEANNNALQPGAYFPVDTTVKLPNGVVADDIQGGQLSILASDTAIDGAEE